MDIYETRRRNLQYIVDEKFPGHGQKARLSELMGWKSQRSSAILREKNPKNIGGTTARLLEQKFCMPRGWLDLHRPEMWNGSYPEVSESKKPPYVITPEQVQTQSLPLLNDKEAVRWIDGERFNPSVNVQFPVLPSMYVSSSSFVLQETTTSMPPQKPGDFYYIDPEIRPEPGEWAATIVDGQVIVGIYERGRTQERISFTDGKEQPIAISKDSVTCKVVTRMDGAFARNP